MKLKLSASTSPNTAKKAITDNSTVALKVGRSLPRAPYLDGRKRKTKQTNNMSTPKSVIDSAKKQGAKMVDVKFVDTFGTWQHFTVPMGELTEEVFEEGFGFDGSSIRGWKSIEASDMLAMPDPATAFIDPFCAVPTLSLTCTIAETGTKEAYNRDPRGIAQRGEAYLKSTKIADTAVFGPEAEFFIFDNVQYDSKANGTFYSVDSEEGDLEHRPR